MVNPVTGLPALDNTMGALYLSIVAAMGIWGVGCVQMYYYYDMFREDRWQLKLLVFVVWALDTAHQGMVIHGGYIYLITEYGNPAFLNNLLTSLDLMVLFTGLVTILVQSFLLYRVWLLSNRNTFIVGFLVCMTLAAFGSTVSFYVRGSKYSHYTEVVAHLSWLVRLLDAMGAATDMCIAVTLCILLQRSRTGFRRSDTLINRLILFTINTGLLTAVFALLAFAFVTAYPKNLIYVTMYIPISRLYTNSLLATLNRRRAARSALNTEVDASSFGDIGFANHSASGPGTGPPESSRRHLTIKVETETQHAHDARMSFALKSLGGSGGDDFSDRGSKKAMNV